MKKSNQRLIFNLVSANQSQKVTLPRLWVKQAVTCPDGPFPASGEGDGGAEPSAASGGCSEAEHPQRSKKSSKRAAQRFFRAPQGGGDKCCRRLPLERICAQYGFRFFDRENLNPYPAQLSVKGVCKGESPVPLCPVLLPFAGAKGRPPRRAVLIKPCKRPCPAEGEMKLYHNYCRQPLSHGCAVPAPLTQGSL